MKTLGKKIAELRKRNGLTQEGLAVQMNVSSQAVSKWENDLSIPDIPTLVELSTYFNVSLDELLKNDEPKVKIAPAEEQSSLDKLILRIDVKSSKGDLVRVNLPMSLVKLAVDIGISLPEVSGNESLQGVDIEKIFQLVSYGVRGRLIEVHSADGDDVIIEVE